jgi:serine/threonine-protein kinase
MGQPDLHNFFIPFLCLFNAFRPILGLEDPTMPSVQPGSKLDHYAIEELVAHTDTASIFRGTDLRTGRKTAIKIPHPEIEGDLLFYQRFRREQGICEKLDHPAVVKAFEDAERSQVYIVMELAEGRLLRQVLSEGKLSVERAVGITLAICEALEYIHTHGVVHRDLKPENIVVDAEDRIKLIDFGIAGQSGARRLTFGKFSQVMGTPDYIAPEQVKGKRGDARADIYALGIMLYEMLTGETPFPGENPFVSMHNRLVNNPVPPCEIDPSITPELQEIIYRALERDPKNRYATAREMVWDLEHQDQVGVAERTELTDWRKRRSQWPRRLAFYAMLALIPVVVFSLLLWVARHT